MTGILLSRALVLVLASPPSATSSSTIADLEVDTSGVGSAGTIVQDLVESRGATLLEALPLPAPAPARLRVKVVVDEIEGDRPGFRFDVRVEPNGRPVEGGTWRVECPLCTETELVESIQTELRKVGVLLGTLGTEDAQPPDGQGTRPVVPSPRMVRDQVDATSPRRAHERGRPRRTSPYLDDPATRAGIGLCVVSLAGLGVGAGLVASPPRPLPDDPTRVRDPRVPGLAALSVGTAALVSGGIALTIGLVRRRRGRATRAQALRSRLGSMGGPPWPPHEPW